MLAISLALVGCASPEEKAQRYDGYADQQFQMNDYFGAAESLYRAVKFDSNDPGRWVKLGRAERMQNNSAQSAMAYQRALDLQPDNIEALQALAVLNLRAGRFDLAKRHVETLLTLSPDDVGGWVAKGAIALFENRLKDAGAAADHLMQISPGISDGPILKSRVLDAGGDREGAIRLLRQRMALDSDNAEVALQTLRLYQMSGNRAGIQDVSLALARLLPDDPRYQLEAARAYRTRELPDQAEQTLAQLATHFPNNVQVLEAIAQQYQETMPKDVAIARIETMAQKAGATARASLARILVALGAPIKALALTVTPEGEEKVSRNTVDLHSAHSSALLAVGRDEEALAEANSVLMFDWSDGGALMTRARINRADKQYSAALSDAQQVFSGEKNNADAALLIAQIYAEQHNDTLAARAFGTAQQNFPDNFRIHTERVNWLIRSEQPSDAAQVAIAFARRVGSLPAWKLADRACRLAGNQLCLDQTRRHIGNS